MNIFRILVITILLSNCCQPVGNYEECVENGGTLCIDMYPKCEEEES